VVKWRHAIEEGTAVLVLVAHRIGPSVYVGPFADMDAVAAWVGANTPGVSWGVIEMQAPEDGAPDWNL
jgi:hypothetical protein